MQRQYNLADGRQTMLQDRLDQIEDKLFRLTTLVEHMVESQLQIIEVQNVFNDKLLKLASVQKELVEAQKVTEERLNILINTVDKMIRRID